MANHRIAYIFIITFLLILFLGCAHHKAEVKRPDLLSKGKKIFIYGPDDKASIKSSLRLNLMNLGFDVVEDNNTAELIADYNYNCFWDRIHYTCRNFNLIVTDAASREVVFKASFRPDFSMNLNYLINGMFNELKEEIGKSPPM